MHHCVWLDLSRRQTRLADICTCLPCCEWLRPALYPGYGQTMHPSPSTTLSFCESASYALIIWGTQLPLNNITTLCCPGSTTITDWKLERVFRLHLVKKQQKIPFLHFFSYCSKCSTWSNWAYLMKLDVLAWFCLFVSTWLSALTLNQFFTSLCFVNIM